MKFSTGYFTFDFLLFKPNKKKIIKTIIDLESRLNKLKDELELIENKIIDIKLRDKNND